MVFTKLDESITSLLCCSLCKNDLIMKEKQFLCGSCGLEFPKDRVQTGEGLFEEVFDFRIHRPGYCMPDGQINWKTEQERYEQSHAQRLEKDSWERYRAEIDSVKEIYTEEYLIEGDVLDVGGHQGRLRHFLSQDSGVYVSVDPFINVFRDMDKQPQLLKAYPSLAEPCNFLAAHAENLPFRRDSFDWIHMRSVVDHFSDPYLAFLEAYRCCRPGGKLLVGLKIIKSRSEKTSRAKWLLGALLRGRAGKKDDHLFRLGIDDLRDLFERTHWHIVKEHWQKPPHQSVVYICGRAQKSPEL